MLRRCLVLACLLALGALAACSSVIDADQARICRTLIPALNPADAVLAITRTVPLAQARELRIFYTARQPGLPVRNRAVTCTFSGAGLSRNKLELLAVGTEAGPLSQSADYFLRRFYLGAPDFTLLDPAGIGSGQALPEVPRAVAYGVQQFLGALPQAGVYALLAASYSLIYGLVGRIVFGFGEIAAIGGYGAMLGVFFALQVGIEHPVAGLALAALFGAVAATMHGAVAGRLVVAPLVTASGLSVLIGTTGLMLVLGEYLRIAQGSDLRWIPPVFNTPIALMRAGSFVTTVTPVGLTSALGCAVAAAGVLVVMRRTGFGRAWRAYADDPLTAALFGVDRWRIFGGTFALSSALAGFAGVVMTGYYGGLGYGMGLVLGLKALVAAVVGGIGSPGGALAGGLVIGLAEALWSATMPIESRDIAVFALLAIVLALRPGGLKGFGDLLPRRV
ncbi:branched-chain amino acid ABC transporter permease [uncultured Alsobacter sp.]|uniref:branched-chain amino acid ABC transporter permease n=1 Tax=uncultured Alsobacter sp. TaxID=1748258 RepID=UPI0025ED5748|nr:branched-chain amino acid ABC transporter permease [uncultured Alsobacter sp.]